MAKTNVITRDVAEKFVEFAESADYTTIITKLPEFNRKNKTKYALNTMLVAISEHICPVELPEIEESKEEDNDFSDVEAEMLTNQPVEQPKAVLNAEITLVAGDFNFSDLNFEFVNAQINAVSEYDTDLKRANDLADQAHQIKNVDLKEINRVTNHLMHEIEVTNKLIKDANKKFRRVAVEKFEAFITYIPVGKTMDKALCSLASLDDFQVQKAIETATYVWNQIWNESKDLDQYRLDILGAENHLVEVKHALDETFARNNEAIDRMHTLGREANEIRRKYGKTPLWNK
jgi:hypothetical protein